ncbi:McrB family protein [Geoalkalibacter halelectricus]|uniref:McrB family protein n=1 Tax=Geoalkalibacter halelectricus TaxID=2847045 RepID=UPI003D2333C8
MNSKSEGAGARACWFVGAAHSGTKDQTARFIKDGVWDTDHEDERVLAKVRSITAGDHIAIKSSYVRKNGLGFDNRGQTVSVMAIKAIGTVRENLGDGRTLKVDWKPFDPPREWYFYTNQSTVWRVLPGDWLTDALIGFTFEEKAQDIDRFRNAPYWRERFGDTPVDNRRFGWTRFYEALADKLLTFRDRRDELITGIHAIASKVDGLSNLQDQFADGSSGPLKDICPFTTMGIFNRGITDANRKAIASELANLLGVSEPIPSSFEGIPVLNNQRSWFFGFENKRQPDDIDVLWEVFAQAIAFAKSEDTEARSAFISAYDNAIQRYGVKWNLSIGFYWIRPWNFPTLDAQSQRYISKKLNIQIGMHDPKGCCNANDYLAVLDTLETRFQEEAFPVHSFPELSLASWKYKEPVGSDDKNSTLKWYGPILDALRAFDGESQPKQIAEFIEKRFNLEPYLLEKFKSGQTRFYNQVCWARQYLVYEELIDNSQRGIWRLTEKGKDTYLTEDDSRAIFLKWVDILKQRREDPEDDEVAVQSFSIDPYSIHDIISDGCFIAREKLEKILERLRTKKNLILQGAPGTGKTWLAKRLAFALMGERAEGKVRAVQFHPNLSYEDFIRGWRPAGEGKLTLVDGPFMEMIEISRNDANSKYVVVIEEINRGNPAQIFGEMLTLLEVDKRTPNEALELSYKRDDERVFIPDNLYVIGTMNIADRSLALVDLALRRRFAFIDLEPTLGKPWHDWVQSKCGIDSEILVEIEKRLIALNSEISADTGLGPQFRVGHSYVTPPFGTPIRDAREWFRQVVDTEIGPLLDEYWFDALEKSRKARERLLEGF